MITMKSHFLAHLLTTILLAGCAKFSLEADHYDPAALRANRWALEQATFGDAALNSILLDKPGAPMQIRFSYDQVEYRNGCNPAAGAYTLVKNILHAKPINGRMVACQDKRLMNADADMQRIFSQPLEVRIGPGDMPRLYLVATSGESLTFIAAYD